MHQSVLGGKFQICKFQKGVSCVFNREALQQLAYEWKTISMSSAQWKLLREKLQRSFAAGKFVIIVRCGSDEAGKINQKRNEGYK